MRGTLFKKLLRAANRRKGSVLVISAASGGVGAGVTTHAGNRKNAFKEGAAIGATIGLVALNRRKLVSIASKTAKRKGRVVFRRIRGRLIPIFKKGL